MVRTKHSIAARRSSGVATGMPIGTSVNRKTGSTADGGERPGDRRLARRHAQRAECEDEKQDVQERIADLGRRQQKAELDRDMTGDLEDREIVILEAVVDMGFRQHREECRSGVTPHRKKADGISIGMVPAWA